jgi:hypothetical protein
LGCAIRIRWAKIPSISIGVAVAGALLRIIHDLLTAFLWFWVPSSCDPACNQKSSNSRMLDLL